MSVILLSTFNPVGMSIIFIQASFCTNLSIVIKRPLPVASTRPCIPPPLMGLPVTHAAAFRSL